MERDLDPCKARWVKSSYSGNGGQCVEIATDYVTSAATLLVRDSKDPNGPVLTFSSTDWAAFTAAVAGGAFGEV
ncbi:DUF397 domain-containing protein [Kitasatospora griseola]|uniref:DUF397 domain-containing protein n=1 Tax=Kitasatospora griseola TaxID=2064 RepID=UPI003801B5BC